jgi:hypothetical protein
MFASKSITEHLVRGTIGIGAIIAALQVFTLEASWGKLAAAAFLMVALVAWRGCPMCWTMGLWQTVTGDSDRSAGKSRKDCGCG